jgi:hypothetical protein
VWTGRPWIGGGICIVVAPDQRQRALDAIKKVLPTTREISTVQVDGGVRSVVKTVPAPGFQVLEASNVVQLVETTLSEAMSPPHYHSAKVVPRLTILLSDPDAETRRSNAMAQELHSLLTEVFLWCKIAGGALDGLINAVARLGTLANVIGVRAKVPVLEMAMAFKFVTVMDRRASRADRLRDAADLALMVAQHEQVDVKLLGECGELAGYGQQLLAFVDAIKADKPLTVF